MEKNTEKFADKANLKSTNTNPNTNANASTAPAAGKNNLKDLGRTMDDDSSDETSTATSPTSNVAQRVGDVIERVGDRIEQAGFKRAGSFVHSVGDNVEHMDTGMATRWIGDMPKLYRDLQSSAGNLVRRNPLLFVAGAVAVGFIASRFLFGASSTVRKGASTLAKGGKALAGVGKDIH